MTLNRVLMDLGKTSNIKLLAKLFKTEISATISVTDLTQG